MRAAFSTLSRSALKLIELNSRYSLFKPGMRVVAIDVPHSWLSIMSAAVESKPHNKLVLAVSDKLLPTIDEVKSCQVNFDENWGSKLDGLFDIAVRYVHVDKEDAWEELSLKASTEHLKALYFLKTYLKPGASVLMKMFSGFNETQHYVSCR